MKLKNYHTLPNYIASKIKNIRGPIVIFGAGGFIGINLLQSLLSIRDDVIGVSKSPNKNWRLITAEISKKNLYKCDITNPNRISSLIKSIKPQTIFNLAAYGAYEKQEDIKKMYETNFIAAVTILSELKKYRFSAYLDSGSSSEYGHNSAGPKETARLFPNSHYAVSKVATAYLIQYFGEVERLPVLHFRLYSVYGPYEERDRLIPVILMNAVQKKYPPLVSPGISRDFVYVNDVVSSFILGAANIENKLYGKTFNVGTGKKTTIKELALLVKKISNMDKYPQFGEFEHRIWDHQKEWYANIRNINSAIGWKPATPLISGLRETLEWQKKYKYD